MDVLKYSFFFSTFLLLLLLSNLDKEMKILVQNTICVVKKEISVNYISYSSDGDQQVSGDFLHITFLYRVLVAKYKIKTSK